VLFGDVFYCSGQVSETHTHCARKRIQAHASTEAAITRSSEQHAVHAALNVRDEQPDRGARRGRRIRRQVETITRPSPTHTNASHPTQPPNTDTRTREQHALLHCGHGDDLHRPAARVRKPHQDGLFAAVRRARHGGHAPRRRLRPPGAFPARHGTALHCTALHCTALHCTAVPVWVG
jgi:hypothetical protein